jgi:hypothetical protein
MKKSGQEVNEAAPRQAENEKILSIFCGMRCRFHLAHGDQQ